MKWQSKETFGQEDVRDAELSLTAVAHMAIVVGAIEYHFRAQVP